MANPTIKDALGKLGEGMFEVALTDFQLFPRPLFDAHHLDGKCPNVDFLVVMSGARGIFFVQVKTTKDPLTASSIAVQLTKDQRNGLAQMPGPTYLAGVYAPTRRCFIRSIDQSSQAGITSIPLKYELNPANLQILYNEVQRYWARRTDKPQPSAFA